MNKGDVILTVILLATLAFFGVNQWNIVNGYEQFAGWAWTTWGVVFGGELLSFALYKIGKGRNAYKAASKSAVVEKLDRESQAAKHAAGKDE